eukprot:1157285-Pelagomonas_calceolata.AAC.5
MVLQATLSPFSHPGRKKKKNHVGRGNSPYINKGKGDTLTQKSLETPPPQSCKIMSANGNLEDLWEHPAP